jgi:AcrR family transcriptional regulator
MRRTKEDADQTKQALLDSALQEFSQRGYQATRLQDVAENAGTTRGAIYHHFQNKAGLYKALIADASQQGNNALQRAVAEGGTIPEITARILTYSLQMLAENSRFRQVMALSLYKTGVSAELADMEAVRMAEAETLVAGIAGFMQAGQQQGQLRDDVSPENMARAFLAYQNGIAFLWLANPTIFSLTDEAESFAQLFLNGVNR